MQTKIVIVDDDEAFRKLLKIRLQSILGSPPEFTEYACLNDARAARGELLRCPPDLVMLDQHLPDGKGIELLEEGLFENLLVLAVSSDPSPEMPGRTVSAGAAYFLGKDHVRSPLFQHLVLGVIERNKIQQELVKSEVDRKVMGVIRTHIGTLRHEINNPLGAVIGAAYLLRNAESATEDQVQAAELVEKSGKRIKHVLDQICLALEQNVPLEEVTKANQTVYHIPGDEPWIGEEDS
ncbi:MAG: response regulator [Bdellovibrionales bacterium]|nr:response regulator [Bdellovibrionales bacterium]